MIRKFEENDAVNLYNYLSKPDVIEFEPYEAFTFEQAKQEAIRRSTDDCFLGVILKDTNVLIGNLYFNEVEKKFNTWEVGYVFSSDYHHMGYATESLFALISLLFNKYNAHRIIAFCNVLNVPSWKLLERLNFRKEGTMLQNIFFKRDEQQKPVWVDSYQYALLEKDFRT